MAETLAVYEHELDWLVAPVGSEAPGNPDAIDKGREQSAKQLGVVRGEATDRLDEVAAIVRLPGPRRRPTLSVPLQVAYREDGEALLNLVEQSVDDDVELVRLTQVGVEVLL